MMLNDLIRELEGFRDLQIQCKDEMAEAQEKYWEITLIKGWNNDWSVGFGEDAKTAIPGRRATYNLYPTDRHMEIEALAILLLDTVE